MTRSNILLLLLPCALSGQPAFPGAEGFGANTPGGRGGKVLLVENLNDSGQGSLREACTTKGPRIIVFRVAGIIELKSPLVIDEPFITIAGQSAPGDGICLRGNQLTVRTHDAIIRFLRVRPGDISGREVDGISIGGDSRNVIIDHCSVSWSVDEALSPSGAVSDITVQWSIIAEALNKSVHSKGAHGYGSLVRAIGGVTLHHNLWAHNNARNPRLGDNYNKPPYPTFDVRNNVMYDYGEMCSGMTGDILSANYIANYIRPGPSSNRKRGIIVLTEKARVNYSLAGNVVDGRPDMTVDNTRLFDRNGTVTFAEKPFPAPAVRTTTAEAALEDVLDRAGACRPVRDAVDARIVAQVRNRTGRIIDSQKDAGGWPVYKSEAPPTDSDRDGIPDAWERANKLNPRDPSDGAAHIERYLDELTQVRPAR